MKKVLLATPITEYKSYIDEKWFAYLTHLKSIYEGLDFFFVDNSINEKYHLKWLKKGFKVEYLREGSTLREIMYNCNDRLRRYFLDNDFDYYFSLEEDVFPPDFAIDHLLAYMENYNVKVMGLPYFIRTGDKSILLNYKVNTLAPLKSMGTRMSPQESFLWCDGTIKPAYQVGMGCLMIHKSVIDNVPFRIDLHDKEKCHTDTYFNEDLRINNLLPLIDTRFICQHYTGDWDKIAKKENV